MRVLRWLLVLRLRVCGRREDSALLRGLMGELAIFWQRLFVIYNQMYA